MIKLLMLRALFSLIMVTRMFIILRMVRTVCLLTRAITMNRIVLVILPKAWRFIIRVLVKISHLRSFVALLTMQMSVLAVS